MNPAPVESIDCTGVSLGNSDIESSSVQGTAVVPEVRTWGLPGHEHNAGVWDNYNPREYVPLQPFIQRPAREGHEL